MSKKVSFISEGSKLIGDLYLPADFARGKKYPTIVVSGSWTTVKEQMAGLYAKKFSDAGLIALAFDFRNYGESEGEPRFYEEPSKKVVDIKNAVSYLLTLDEVDPERLYAFGVCAGAMYTAIATAEDKRIKALTTAASWLHDAEAVKLFYGGDKGVNEKRQAGQKALAVYKETGVMEYIETISTTNPDAAMYGDYDYYLNPNRGGVAEWSNDKFAVATWEEWLTLDPMPYARQIDVPTIMVHSDGCVLPEYTKDFYNRLASTEKTLVWFEKDVAYPMEHQFNFYDQEKETNFAVSHIVKYLAEQTKGQGK